MYFLHVLLLCLVTTCNAWKWPSAEFWWFGRPAPAERSCSREGIMCKDCHTLVACKNDGSFTFSEEMVKRCTASQWCDESVLDCSSTGACRYSEFTCPESMYSEEVRFPDPYSCRKYHACKSYGTHIEQRDYECSPGEEYDVLTHTCRQLQAEFQCNASPVPLCRYQNQKGFVESTNISYKCHLELNPIPKLFPKLELVTHDRGTAESLTSFGEQNENHEVDDSDHKLISLKDDDCIMGNHPILTDCSKYNSCHGNPDGSMTSTTGSCAQGEYFDPIQLGCLEGTCRVYVTQTTTEKTLTTTETIKYNCPGLGRFEDPHNCHMYIDCVGVPDGGFVAHLIPCNDTQYFDTTTLQCVNGECPYTTPATHTFHCTAVGNFPFVGDCHKYNKCFGESDGTLHSTVESCPEGEHFDETNEECVEGDNCFGSTTQHPLISTTWGPTYPFSCNKSGYFPDIYDCSSFYECFTNNDGLLHILQVKCKNGDHFNQTKGGCAPGECLFQCPGLGDYQDYTDCHKYYSCVATPYGNITATHCTCPHLSYFNKVTSDCQRGTCTNTLKIYF